MVRGWLRARREGRARERRGWGPRHRGHQRQNPNFQPLQHPPASVTCEQPPDCCPPREVTVKDKMKTRCGPCQGWGPPEKGGAWWTRGCLLHQAVRSAPGTPRAAQKGAQKGKDPQSFHSQEGTWRLLIPAGLVCVCAHTARVMGAHAWVLECVGVMVQERLSYRQ